MSRQNRIFAIANQKGGVGKTTSAVNLAASFAVSERRTLLIDLDPQANATSAFGVSVPDRHVYDALLGERVMKDVTIPTDLTFLQLVPSGPDLVGAEIELVSMPQRERRLELALADVREKYEIIVIDCPPSLGLLTVNALTGADAVLVPIQCEYYALEGLTQLIATINLVRDDLNPDLEISGVVLTMFDARTNLSSEVAAEVRRHLHGAVFETIVPRSVRLSEAPSHGLPIALYRPDSKGADAYARLAQELRARRGAFDRVIVPASLAAGAVA